MKRLLIPVVLLVAAIPVAADLRPEIAFDSANPLKLPDHIYLGEAAGVATNSKGDVFVYTRTGHPTISIGTARPFAHGGSRLFQFDKTGKFVREIGQDRYGFLVAQQVRVDPQDNIWIVDQMSSMVIKFDPNGRVACCWAERRRRSESRRRRSSPQSVPLLPAEHGAALRVRPRPRAAAGGRGGGPPGAGAQSDLSTAHRRRLGRRRQHLCGRRSGQRPHRQVRQERQVHQVLGIRGLAPGQFNTVQRDRARRAGQRVRRRRRQQAIQVFDGDGNFQDAVPEAGTPAAMCITPGAHQYLYSSNSNPADDIDINGEIYKMELTGKIVGRFGKAGKLPKEFGTVNAIDCRSDNELYVEDRQLESPEAHAALERPRLQGLPRGHPPQRRRP